MTTNRRDVQLVIRARAEGEKLVEQLTRAIQNLGSAEDELFGGAARGESQLRKIAAAMAALAAVTDKLDTAAGKGSTAFDRQRASLTALEQQLENVRAQMAAARQAVPGAETRLIDARLAGGTGAREVAELQAAQKAIADLTAQEARLGNEIRTTRAALGESTIAFQALASAANAADAALADAGGPERVADIEAQADAFRDQAAAAEALAAAAREMGRADQELAAKADNLRRKMDPLAAIQEKLKRDLKDVRDLHRAGAISAEELARAEAHLSQEAKEAADALERVGRGERGRVGLFGLKPYELTNLGYQVNDIFTQLASGTSLTQTLAQQGGQLLQLFPRLGASIVAALGNPVIISAAAGLGLIVMAVNRLSGDANRLRDFNGMLASMGDGAEYSAVRLTGTVTEMRRLGIATEDAEKAVRRFVTAGVAPEYIDRFAMSARNLARIMGVDLAQASELVATGLTGSFEQVQQLQRATQFLSATEEARIRTLYEEGRASEARSEAARIFNERMEQGASQAKGPWERAWSSLKRAWDSLLNSIANSAPIQFAIGLFERLADTIRGVVDALSHMADTNVMRSVERGVLLRLRQLREQVRDDPTRLAEIDRQIAALEARLGEARAQSGDTVNNAEQQRRRAEQLGGIAFQREIVALQGQYEAAVTRAAQIRIQGEIEYRTALRETGDQQIAQQRRLLAEERERNRSRLVGERAIQFAIRRIIAVESGGNPNARNPRPGQTASGLGQFTDETWLSRFRSYFPERAASMTQRQILQLKTNAEMGRRMTELFIRENARILQQAGLEVTALNLYIMHFLGQGGGPRFLRAPGNTPIRNLVSPAAIRANPEYLGGAGATRDSVYARIGRRFGGEGADNEGDLEAESAILEQIQSQEAQRAERQRQFNVQLDQELANTERRANQQRALLGLSGEQSLDLQRQQAIENAVQAARDQATQQQIKIDEDRLKRIREVTALEWDIAHARERATRAVDDISGERNSLVEQIRAAMEDGATSRVSALQERLQTIDDRLAAAIGRAIQFWRAFNTPESRQAIMALEQLARGINRTQEDLRREVAQQSIDRTQAMREEMRQQIEFAERAGNMEVGRALRQQLRDLDGELLRAIDHMIQFWSTSERPEAAQMVMRFQNLRNEVVATHDQFRIFAGDIQQSFAQSFTSSIERWAQALGEGRNVIRSTWEMAKGFAADFIRSLGQMLLQALALKLAMKLGFERVAGTMNSVLNVGPLAAAGVMLKGAGTELTEAGGTLGTASLSWLFTAGMIMKAATMLAAANFSQAASGSGGIGGLFKGGLPTGFGIAGLFHTGGIAGQAKTSRSVWDGVFAGMTRYHRGGLAGLRPGEIPAILQEGEEILDRANPRHIMNGGAVVEPKVDLQNVICMDPADWFAKGLNSRPGQKSLMSFLRANSQAIRTAID